MSNKKPIVDKGLIIYYDYDFIFNFLTDEEVGKTIRLLIETKDNPTLNPTDNASINNAYNYIASRIIEYKNSKGLAVKWGKSGGNPKLMKVKGTLKGKDKGGDKTGDKLIEKNRKENKIIEKNRKEKENFDFIENPEWKNLFEKWINYRIKIKKPLKPVSHKSAYDKLVKLSNGDLIKASEIIGNSVANGWQGLFALKKEPVEKSTIQSNDDVFRNYLNKNGE